MNNSKRSLRRGTTSKDKWYPIPVNKWTRLLGALEAHGSTLIPDPDLRKNLAYNLQYLEYLQQTIRELSLSTVLVKQTYKSYIIVGTGILESILFHLVKCHGEKTKDLNDILNLVKEMSLLGADRVLYKNLHKFRMLRNKVHLYEFRNDLGTDYIEFGAGEFAEMRATIFCVATSDVFGLSESKKRYFDFLSAENQASEI